MNLRATGVALAALIAVGTPGPASADDRRGGEAGVLVGVLAADETMTGESGSSELTFGLRGGSVFSRRWGWFVDGLYTELGTKNGLGDAKTYIGRTGADLLFQPERDARWLISFGAGWMATDYENSATADFHNPIASLGFGQRIRLGGGTRLRWELRGDATLDDARLTDDLFQAHAVIGLLWGPGGIPAARDGDDARRRQGDADADGVRDGRDRCPATPEGAVVDSNGCARDDDRDGVPNGIDRCPATRTDDRVGPDGCPADADGDGVPDVTDVCPRTPAAAEVDEWGCPGDADRDSIFDGIDECPRTPLGARVDARGCPADTDGDGVFDGRDRCPGTSAGVPVDAAGCAFDSDGDGVPDGIDACPDTAPGTRVVDARGCARPVDPFEPGRDDLVLEDVEFDTDRATLTASSVQVLDRVAAALRAHPGMRIEIAGHTDSAGDEAHNLELSRRRAASVRERLIASGVAPERLVARGYGAARPIADNATAEGRSRNRRVELHRLPD